MSARELREIYHSKTVLLEDEQIEEGKVVKPMKIGGVATQGNVVNENARYYRTKLWGRECERKQDAIKAGKMLGELDHPVDGKSRLSGTSVRYTKLEMDGDYMNFEGLVGDTVAGQNLKALLRLGVGVDISTRGFGSTKKETMDGKEVEVVQDDFELVGIDQVAGHSSLSAEIQYYQEKKDSDLKGGDKMNLEQLKKDHPELVQALVKETEERVKKEVTDQLTKDFEERILDEISKNRETIVSEVTAEVKKTLVPQYENYENMLGEIAEIVKDFIGEETEPKDKDEHVTALEAKVKAQDESNKQLRTDLDEAKAKIAKGEVKEYLDEVLANERFKKLLRGRLSDCKTKEEVDERLPKEKEYVDKIVQEDKVPSGDGEVLDKDQTDKKVLDEKADAETKRQQRLAGVD